MHFEYISKNGVPKKKRKPKSEYVVVVEQAFENGEECIVFHCDNMTQKRCCYQSIYNMRHRRIGDNDVVEDITCCDLDVYVTLGGQK